MVVKMRVEDTRVCVSPPTNNQCTDFVAVLAFGSIIRGPPSFNHYTMTNDVVVKQIVLFTMLPPLYLGIPKE